MQFQFSAATPAIPISRPKIKRGFPLTVGKIAAGTWVGNILNVTGKRIKPGINFLEINYPDRFRVYSASI